MTDPTTIIRVVDLETTGFAPPAEICEIGWSDLVGLHPDLIGQPTDWSAATPDEVRYISRLVRTDCPIPPETSAIHHIVDEDLMGPHVAEWPRIGCEVATLFDGRPIPIFAAHNARMERQWLTPEVIGDARWICTYKAALRLWPDAPSHSNQALRYWRRLPVDREIADRAHRAGPDAYVTAALLADIFAQPDVTIDRLVAWTEEPALLAKCRMGSWRGRRWSEIDEPSFLEWVLRRDFDEDTLFTARFYLDRMMEAING